MAEVDDLMQRLNQTVEVPATPSAPAPAPAPAPQAAIIPKPTPPPATPPQDVSNLFGALSQSPATPGDAPAPVASVPSLSKPSLRTVKKARAIPAAPRKPNRVAAVNMAALAPKPITPTAPAPSDQGDVFAEMGDILGLEPVGDIESETATATATTTPPATPTEPTAETTTLRPRSERTTVSTPPPGFPLPPDYVPPAEPDPTLMAAEKPIEETIATMPSSKAAGSAQLDNPATSEHAKEDGGFFDAIADLFGSDEPSSPAEQAANATVSEPAMAEAIPAPAPTIQKPAGTLFPAPESPSSVVPPNAPDPFFADPTAANDPAPFFGPADTADYADLPGERPSAPADAPDDGSFLGSLRELVDTGPEAQDEEIDELLSPLSDEQQVLRDRARARFAADTEARQNELLRIAAEQKAEREARAAARLADTQAQQRRLDERALLTQSGIIPAATSNPGFVAPPDGGTSGERFLSRLGNIFGIDISPSPSPEQEAINQEQAIARATGQPGPAERARLMPSGQSTVMANTPRNAPSSAPRGQTKPSQQSSGGLIDQISNLFIVEQQPAIAETGSMIAPEAIDPLGMQLPSAPQATLASIAPKGQAHPIALGPGPSAATQPLPDETIDFFDRLAQNLGIGPAHAPDPMTLPTGMLESETSLLGNPPPSGTQDLTAQPAPSPAPTTAVAEAQPSTSPEPEPVDGGLFGPEISGDLPSDESASDSGFWGESDGSAASDAPATGLFADDPVTTPLGALDRAPIPSSLDATQEGTAQPNMPPGPPPAPESWQVKNVQTARLPADQATEQAFDDLRTETLLSGAGMTIGNASNLGRTIPTIFDEADLKKSCIFKRRNTITVCIEPLDWPEALAPIVIVNTVMYQGLNAIVRYDKGVVSRYHVLFPAEAFDTVISHFVSKYGSPSEVWRRTIAPLAAPRQENPTVVWRNMNPATQALTTLEIRKFDDTRGGFPDTQRGVLMLYAAGADPVFPQVSSLELMRLRPIGANE